MFVDFINQVNAHIQKNHPGTKLRIWNDGLKAFNNVTLDKNILVEWWYRYGTSAKDLLTAGYDLVNADSRLYFTRNGPYSNVTSAWNDNWTPKRFASDVLDDSATTGKIKGGKLTLWPDNGPGTTENTLFTFQVTPDAGAPPMRRSNC